MEKLERLNNLTEIKNPIDQISLIRMSSQISRSKQPSIFNIEMNEESDRLELFSTFCLNNKDLLNQIFKDKNCSSNVIEVLKYIPNLLTMENKTQIFLKEIDKIKTYEYFEPTVKRDSIFIDSFHQFIYLTPKQLKG